MKFFMCSSVLIFSHQVLANIEVPQIISTTDEYTYSNYQEVTTTHLFIDLTVDFNSKTLKGFVEHDLQWHVSKVIPIILDTRDVTIHKILAKNKAGVWKKSAYSLGNRDNVLGSKLTILNTFNPKKIRIYYQSQPVASGLQWLTSEQTAGKSHPFVYSQNQAIHARSWIPSQDTPSVRSTYSARIKNDNELVSVMSANNATTTFVKGESFFNMPQPIPAYLIALAVGDLEFKGMSQQTGIYAEPSILNSALAEFDDTQAMIETAESLYGEYRWGRYDLLILPPSFPYGGMENPRLSFITPTVIAGDKSLVNLIAHELAHSWAGNLVTNASWEDLWLNEGVTSYVENRIMENTFGVERAIMEQSLASDQLYAELKTIAIEDTKLSIKLAARDPDASFTQVPYVKGHLFLLYLENKFGREHFDTFLKKYFDDYSFRSITTQKFISYLNQNLIHKYPNTVTDEKIQEWIYGVDMPSDTPAPSPDAFINVQKSLDNWLKQKLAIQQLPTSTWTVHEWLYFLNHLPLDLSLERVATLDKTFKLTQSTNAEILFAWYMYAISKNYDVILPSLEKYLVTVGRRKLIAPLYQTLIKSNKKEWAMRVYSIAKPGYHSLSKNTIDALFNTQ